VTAGFERGNEVGPHESPGSRDDDAQGRQALGL
jgi:hypothetical protein